MELTSFPWINFRRISSPLANSTLYAAIWLQLILAINRFCAISYPIIYPRIFNRRNAWMTVISLWSCSTLIAALYYNIECANYFETRIHSWSTLYGPCNHAFYAYIATFLSDVIIFISAVIDAIAFYRIITYLKAKECRGNNAAQQRCKHEIVFFKETCVSTAIHAIFAAIFRIDIPVSRLTKITYVWLSILTLDGLAFVYFNHRVLTKQNAVGFHISTMGLQTKTVRNDVNAAT
ncbi:Serpentine type 7TM GPCR chemoreceptor Srx family protein [Acanthocheilonema viteae]|uniref:G-protein coupled receptors family 1 profile domain-containing protein n=1 Tax=Acanthocheilonema viteae TaxID=6277 RepID=A0A498SD38_ACAVI|nr:unnamed protein product [Acanthocheilonema viteae]